MFADKTVVVTGASSGIGQAVAEAFAAKNANLVITGRNQERLEEAGKRCKELGAKQVLEVIADLRNTSEIKALADKVSENFPNIDILVNNAGSTAVCTFMETKLEDLERMLDTNIRAPFFLTQLLLPRLIKTKGCVVNISSFTSTNIVPRGLGYGISKAGLDHFTAALAFECSAVGVRINSVSPAAVKTRQMAEDCKLSQAEIDGVLHFMANLQPLGTLNGIISAEDVAKSVLFLASPDASCITGHNLKIEAGYNAYHAMKMC